MRKNVLVWGVLIAANVLLWCVLGLQQTTGAAQQRGQQPFANSVEQRNQMIEQLRELNAQLREQNTLLRSGRLTVVVHQDAE